LDDVFLATRGGPSVEADFFSIAGSVTYVKFAGSDFNPSRFGFVEFDCKAAAESAKALTGTMLAEMTLKAGAYTRRSRESST
jgi:hypothetical protein